MQKLGPIPKSGIIFLRQLSYEWKTTNELVESLASEPNSIYSKLEQRLNLMRSMEALVKKDIQQTQLDLLQNGGYKSVPFLVNGKIIR